MSKKQLVINVEPETFRFVQNKSATEKRSLSSAGNIMLERYIEQHKREKQAKTKNKK